RDLLKFQIDLFLGKLPEYLASLRQALSAADHESLRRTAHTLKGHVAAFSAGAAQAALRLEELAKEGQLDAAEEALAKLGREIDRLKPALKAWSGGADGS